MLTKREHDTLTVAKRHLEDMIDILYHEWENGSRNSLLLRNAQLKALEIFGEKVRQIKRLLYRYITIAPWRVIIDEKVEYAHPGDEYPLHPNIFGMRKIVERAIQDTTDFLNSEESKKISH